MCAKACPYNAIAHVSRPCKDSCPVDAISYDEYGVSVIDEEKCIRCGQCARKMSIRCDTEQRHGSQTLSQT